MRTTLDSLAEMAAALWPTRSASLTVHGWQTPATALMTDADDPDGAPLALASAEAPDAAVAALVTTLRAMARERAAVLLAAAGEPQPADRGVRRGARLSDDALRHVALDVLRAEGVTAASTLRRVAVAIVDAIRQAERRADERDDAVERVAEDVVRHVVAEGVASFDDHMATRVGDQWISTALGRAVDHVRDAIGRRVRVAVEVLPEGDGAAVHGESIGRGDGGEKSRAGGAP